MYLIIIHLNLFTLYCRSPGGTPLRTKPLETEGTDASSIIAKALKKKFAQRRKLRDADSPSKSSCFIVQNI